MSGEPQIMTAEQATETLPQVQVYLADAKAHVAGSADCVRILHTLAVEHPLIPNQTQNDLDNLLVYAPPNVKTQVIQTFCNIKKGQILETFGDFLKVLLLSQKSHASRIRLIMALELESLTELDNCINAVDKLYVDLNRGMVLGTTSALVFYQLLKVVANEFGMVERIKKREDYTVIQYKGFQHDILISDSDFLKQF